MSGSDLFDPNDPETLREPHRAYARLREQAPAYYIESWNSWAFSRFEDIWAYSNDTEHLTALEGTTAPYLVTGALEPGRNLNHMDPPEQGALRRELMSFFLPAAMRDLESRVRAIVVECLEPLVARGGADAYAEIGQVIATRVASGVIGFAESDRDVILALLQRFFASVGAAAGTEQSGADAMIEMRRYLAQVSAERRSHAGPPENLIDTLLRSPTVGSSASDDELGEHLVPLLVGATETFPKLTAAAIYRLWQHPDQRKAVVQDPRLRLRAIRECLRFDMPTQMSMRRVTKKFRVHGKTLRPGQSVTFLWASGNRDEREFSDPNRFDIHRAAPRTLSFGNGVHRCVGANLAELQGRVLFDELLRRAPEYEVDESGIEIPLNAFFHAYARMPVRF
jgi:cytochrome P450